MSLAVSTGIAVLSLVGLAVGLFILATVLALFIRVVRPLLEVNDYAKDVLAAATGIADGVEGGVNELARTRDLATSLPPLAVAYLEIVKKELS